MDYPTFCAKGANVSRETFGLFKSYAELLCKWNPRINLVSPATLPDMWTRHIIDSLQLVEHAPERGVHWLDLGSGGGLPGLIIAIANRNEATKVTLVESDRRKASFLRTAIRTLGLDVDVIADRVEGIPPISADVITARALARLSRLLEFQMRHGAANGVGLYPKGTNAGAEIGGALERWRFSCEKIPSATSADSQILKIGDIRRA